MAFFEEYSERLNEQPLHIRVGHPAPDCCRDICHLLVFLLVAQRPRSSDGAENKLRQERDKDTGNTKRSQPSCPKFEKEYKRLDREFQLVARKLPKDKEIPGLIDGVYSEIAASNLESIIFAPKPQVTKEIYAEIPIEMEVIGTYFNLADFFDRISRLPRIVNVRDLQLTRNNIRGGNVILNVKFDVVTFRLLPPQEAKPQDNKKTKGKKREK